MVYQFEDRRPKVVDFDNRLLPPQAVEFEEAILGAILTFPGSIDRVVGRLKPEAFYTTAHQEIYRAALALRHQDKPIDLTIITLWLHEHNLLEKVGGQGRLIDLAEPILTDASIDLYAEVVQEKWRRRQVIQLAAQLNQMARDPMLDWTQLLSEAERGLFALSDPAENATGLRPLSDILCDETLRLEQVANGEAEAGVMTLFYDLDAMLQGLKPGQLIVVASRPSMGKTALAGAILLNVSRQNHPAALFSLEMSREAVARRLWSSESSVESGLISSGRLPDHAWGMLLDAVNQLSGLPLAIDSEANVSPAYIRSKSRAYKAKHGGRLGLIVVDYLHLMVDGDEENETRELGRVTRAMKRLAVELNVPIILLSQLNRAVESRNNKRPMMSDLRQSGAIEQDADVVLLLYRDEYYNPDTPERGLAEIIVGKQREGPVGIVKLLFEPHYCRFRNLARRDYA